MEALYQRHIEILNNLEVTFRRDFIDEIAWEEQLIGIKGARGVGKTTLVLQHISETYGTSKECLYISLDDISISFTSLVELAEAFYKKGGKCLCIDEIHKYPNWSQELKNIYDRYKKLKVIFTGSSILHIYGGYADLSRRAVSYTLPGLSFREYIEIESKKTFKKVSLEELVKNHTEIATAIVKKVQPLKYFETYLAQGYYPFFLQGGKTYNQKLLNIINLTLELDIPYLKNVDLKNVSKLKKLLYILATEVPFQPNISKLAASLEMSRNSVLEYLSYLADGHMINLLTEKSKSYSLLAKPEKIFLHNTNLTNTISGNKKEIGTIRETFFYNQTSIASTTSYTEKGDFLVADKYIFEVGGKSKTFSQIKGVKNAYVAADDIEIGIDKKIPLWLFGFMY